MVNHFLLAIAVGLSGPLLTILPVNWGTAAGTAFPPLVWLIVFSFAHEAHGRKSAWLLITSPLLFVAPIKLLAAFGQL